MSVREKDSQRRRQEAGSSDSGPVDVILTENREGHVGVSGGPDALTRTAPPPSLSATISLSVASPPNLLLSQSCPVHLSHYNDHPRKRCNLSNHVLH